MAASAIDLADEILGTLGRNRQQIEIARAAIDEVAGASRGLHRDAEHRMHDQALTGAATA